MVQRKNDNSFYLDHNFSKEKSSAGTLFMDGSNLLTPEDDCLIVYGHNMRNGTMFHSLCSYEKLDFLKKNALARFDTLYENRVYAPFAVLSVSAEPESPYYVNIRQFDMGDADILALADELRKRSVLNIPIDVCGGDKLLLLVTCEYVHDNGRFVVALRALRENETQPAMRRQVQKATLKRDTKK